MAHYIEIHLRENESTNWLGRPLYHALVHALWQRGAPGMTVFRGEEGLDRRGHVQNSFSEYHSQSLPITLHMVVEEWTEVDPLIALTRSELTGHDYFLFHTEVHMAKSKLGPMKGVHNMGRAATLKIYMKEEDRANGLPLYHEIVKACRERNILWVNVQMALEGFGADHVIRRNRLFEFSSHSPLLVEVSDTVEKINALAEQLQPLLARSSGPSIVQYGTFLSGDSKPETP